MASKHKYISRHIQEYSTYIYRFITICNTMDLLKSKAAPASDASRTERSSRTSDTLRTSTMHVTTSYDQQRQRHQEPCNAWRGYLALFTVLLFAAHINTTSGQIDWDDDDDPGEWVSVASRTKHSSATTGVKLHRARLDSCLSAVICINLQRFPDKPDNSSMEITENLQWERHESGERDRARASLERGRHE